MLEAASGVKALDVFNGLSPDLVISDAILPDMKGRDLVLKIRGASKWGDQVPLICITAGAVDEAIERSLVEADCHVDGIFRRPLNLDDLLATTEDLLTSRPQPEIRETVEVFRPADPFASLSFEEQAQQPQEREAPALSYQGPYIPPREQPQEELHQPEPSAFETSEQQKIKPSVSISEPMTSAEKGEFRETPLHKLLMRAHKTKATGRLFVKGQHTRITTILEDGEISDLRTNHISEKEFGRFLIRRGKLDFGDFEQAVKTADPGGRPVNDVLVEMGVLSPDDIKAQMQEYISEEMTKIILNRNGTYEFLPSGVEPSSDPNPVDIGPLLFATFRRKSDDAQVFKSLRRNSDRIMELALDSPFSIEEMDLYDDEKQVVDFIDGTRTIDQLLEVGEKKDQTAYILYALKILGMVRFKGGKAEAPRKSEQPHRPEAAWRTASTQKAEATKWPEPPVESRPKERVETKIKPAPAPDFDPFSVDEIEPAKKAPKSIEELNFEIPDASERDVHGYKYAASEKTLQKLEARRVKPAAKEKKIEQVDISQELSAATKMLEAGMYQQAQEILEKLARKGVPEPKVYVKLGWAIYNNQAMPHEDRILDAIECIKAGLSIRDNFVEGYLMLGSIYKEENNLDLAKRNFQLALHFDPLCQIAENELRFIKIKQENP